MFSFFLSFFSVLKEKLKLKKKELKKQMWLNKENKHLVFFVNTLTNFIFSNVSFF